MLNSIESDISLSLLRESFEESIEMIKLSNSQELRKQTQFELNLPIQLQIDDIAVSIQVNQLIFAYYKTVYPLSLLFNE